MDIKPGRNRDKVILVVESPQESLMLLDNNSILTHGVITRAEIKAATYPKEIELGRRVVGNIALGAMLSRFPSHVDYAEQIVQFFKNELSSQGDSGDKAIASGPVSPELIQERTGYRLIEVFTDFAVNGRVSPDLHEERERLSEALGEDNVLSSMYVDDKGEIQLGLFVREPQS